MTLLCLTFFLAGAGVFFDQYWTHAGGHLHAGAFVHVVKGASFFLLLTSLTLAVWASIAINWWQPAIAWLGIYLAGARFILATLTPTGFMRPIMFFSPLSIILFQLAAFVSAGFTIAKLL